MAPLDTSSTSAIDITRLEMSFICSVPLQQTRFACFYSADQAFPTPPSTTTTTSGCPVIRKLRLLPSTQAATWRNSLLLPLFAAIRGKSYWQQSWYGVMFRISEGLFFSEFPCRKESWMNSPFWNQARQMRHSIHNHAAATLHVAWTCDCDLPALNPVLLRDSATDVIFRMSFKQKPLT